MANVHVVTEDLASLPHEAELNYGITVVGGSQVTGVKGASYSAAFKELLGWGVEVVSLHAPASLGGRAADARAAFMALPAGSSISIVETVWIGPALGLLALEAAKAGDQADRERTVTRVEAASSSMRMAFAITDLAQLGRTGRIGPLRALVARALGLAAVCSLRDGEPVLEKRVRPQSAALAPTLDIVAKGAGESGAVHLGLASSGADAEAAAIATVLSTRLQPAEGWISSGYTPLEQLVGSGAYAVALWEE